MPVLRVYDVWLKPKLMTGRQSGLSKKTETPDVVHPPAGIDVLAVKKFMLDQINSYPACRQLCFVYAYLFISTVNCHGKGTNDFFWLIFFCVNNAVKGHKNQHGNI